MVTMKSLKGSDVLRTARTRPLLAESPFVVAMGGRGNSLLLAASESEGQPLRCGGVGDLGGVRR